MSLSYDEMFTATKSYQLLCIWLDEGAFVRKLIHQMYSLHFHDFENKCCKCKLLDKKYTTLYKYMNCKFAEIVVRMLPSKTIFSVNFCFKRYCLNWYTRRIRELHARSGLLTMNLHQILPSPTGTFAQKIQRKIQQTQVIILSKAI